jgi:hypothetical protein
VHWRWEEEEREEQEGGGEEEQGEQWHCYIPPAALISMPFPDGSMPFNVITMVSTVVALLLGSMMNVLVRKSSLTQPAVTVKTETKTKTNSIKDKLARVLKLISG